MQPGGRYVGIQEGNVLAAPRIEVRDARDRGGPPAAALVGMERDHLHACACLSISTSTDQLSATRKTCSALRRTIFSSPIGVASFKSFSEAASRRSASPPTIKSVVLG